MKKLKVNLMMVFALLIGAVAMSFNLVENTTAWHYTGTVSGPFNDASSWEIGAGSGCGPIGPNACQINVEATNKTELEQLFTDLELESEDVYDMASKRN